MTNTTLDNLAKIYGTDKFSGIHNYCVKYEKYLPFQRYEELKIMEIGVQEGKSLKTWKDYFYRSKILGIDIDPSCIKHTEDRIIVEIGSQTDEGFLKGMKLLYGPFDMILDDGSHINSDVIFSFEHLFGAVKPGGVYVIEDACTSYWESYGGGRYLKGSIMEYFKGLTDEVSFFGEYREIINGDNIIRVLDRREDCLIEQFKRKGYDYIGTQIESINFLNSMIIITKR